LVLKILHGLEDRIEDVRQRYDAHVVYLIRHPIAVSLSRKECPRLKSLIQSDYSRHFTKSQLAYAEQVLLTGEKLERLMVSWCMQNYVPLKSKNSNWILLTYEQLTIDPEAVLSSIYHQLELSDISKISENLLKASDSSNLSDQKTQDVLSTSSGEERQKYLVEKWKDKIDEKQEEKLMNILKVFDIDIYEAGSCLPKSEYQI
jgi:hypothetical protein